MRGAPNHDPANRAALAAQLATVAQQAVSTRQVVIPLDVIGRLPSPQVEAEPGYASEQTQAIDLDTLQTACSTMTL